MRARPTAIDPNLLRNIKPSPPNQLAHSSRLFSLGIRGWRCQPTPYRCFPFIPGSHISPSPDALPRGVKC